MNETRFYLKHYAKIDFIHGLPHNISFILASAGGVVLYISAVHWVLFIYLLFLCLVLLCFLILRGWGL